MANISVKYQQGDKVRTKLGGVEGIITAIFIRGEGRTYEFSYIDNGTPSCTNVQELEIEPSKEGKLGFGGTNG